MYVIDYNRNVSKNVDYYVSCYINIIESILHINISKILYVLYFQFLPKNDQDGTKQGDGEVRYKMYPARWWVLWTSVGIQIFNYAHFAAYPSVQKNLSKYYNQVYAHTFAQL